MGRAARAARAGAAVRPVLFRAAASRGLRMFFFQYFVQSGAFPSCRSSCRSPSGSRRSRDRRAAPAASITLLIGAIGIPRFFPDVSPRRSSGSGCSRCSSRRGASRRHRLGRDREHVLVPLLLLGPASAPRLPAQGVTVSSVPDEPSPEVGGLQNTATNLGPRLTALAGSRWSRCSPPRSSRVSRTTLMCLRVVSQSTTARRHPVRLGRRPVRGPRRCSRLEEDHGRDRRGTATPG